MGDGYLFFRGRGAAAEDFCDRRMLEGIKNMKFGTPLSSLF
jgi:hypothetical protein